MLLTFFPILGAIRNTKVLLGSLNEFLAEAIFVFRVLPVLHSLLGHVIPILDVLLLRLYEF